MLLAGLVATLSRREGRVTWPSRQDPAASPRCSGLSGDGARIAVALSAVRSRQGRLGIGGAASGVRETSPGRSASPHPARRRSRIRRRWLRWRGSGGPLARAPAAAAGAVPTLRRPRQPGGTSLMRLLFWRGCARARRKLRAHRRRRARRQRSVRAGATRASCLAGDLSIVAEAAAGSPARVPASIAFARRAVHARPADARHRSADDVRGGRRGVGRRAWSMRARRCAAMQVHKSGAISREGLSARTERRPRPPCRKSCWTPCALPRRDADSRRRGCSRFSADGTPAPFQETMRRFRTAPRRGRAQARAAALAVGNFDLLQVDLAACDAGRSASRIDSSCFTDLRRRRS